MEVARSSRRIRQLTEDDYQLEAEFRYSLRKLCRQAELCARREGITPQQHLLLLTIRGHPSYPNRVNVADVADRLQISTHAASLLIRRTERRGLLSRTGDCADKRRVLLMLTDDGMVLLERISLANRSYLGAFCDYLYKIDLFKPLERA